MKRLIQTILTFLLITVVNISFGQTKYSIHPNPQAGVEYDTTTTSGCANCQILDPDRGADTSLSNASRIMVQGGPHDEASLKLKLTDTVAGGGKAGVAFIRSGSANATVLSSMVVTTYLGGVLQETATGSGLTSYVIDANTGLRAVEFTTTKNFDAVAISLEKLGSGVNWADIYYAYGGSPAALPVELINFTAKTADRGVNINWVTASEYNNSHFIVERSTNGKDFKSIDNINGHGTTTNIKHYSATDYSPAQGINYYRLTQVDYDGQTSYSKIITIKYMNENNIPPKVYPNPAINSVNISFSQSVSYANVKVGDMMGNILVNQPINNETTQIQVDLSTIQAGNYIVYVFANDGTLIHKQLITKVI